MTHSFSTFIINQIEQQTSGSIEKVRQDRCSLLYHFLIRERKVSPFLATKPLFFIESVPFRKIYETGDNVMLTYDFFDHFFKQLEHQYPHLKIVATEGLSPLYVQLKTQKVIDERERDIQQQQYIRRFLTRHFKQNPLPVPFLFYHLFVINQHFVGLIIDVRSSRNCYVWFIDSLGNPSYSYNLHSYIKNILVAMFGSVIIQNIGFINHAYQSNITDNNCGLYNVYLLLYYLSIGSFDSLPKTISSESMIRFRYFLCTIK